MKWTVLYSGMLLFAVVCPNSPVLQAENLCTSASGNDPKWNWKNREEILDPAFTSQPRMKFWDLDRPNLLCNVKATPFIISISPENSWHGFVIFPQDLWAIFEVTWGNHVHHQAVSHPRSLPANFAARIPCADPNKAGTRQRKRPLCDADIEFLGCFFTAASLTARKWPGKGRFYQSVPGFHHWYPLVSTGDVQRVLDFLWGTGLLQLWSIFWSWDAAPKMT